MHSKIQELSSLFGTKTKRRTISLFLSEPKKEWYGKEIAERVGVTSASVYQQIDDLVKHNLLIEMKKGRMRFFKVNSNHWLIKQLK